MPLEGHAPSWPQLEGHAEPALSPSLLCELCVSVVIFVVVLPSARRKTEGEDQVSSMKSEMRNPRIESREPRTVNDKETFNAVPDFVFRISDLSPSPHHSITPLPQAVPRTCKPLFSAIALPPRLVGENKMENHWYTIVSPWYDLSQVPDRTVSPNPDANTCGRAFFSGIGLLPRLEGRYNGENPLYTVVSARYELPRCRSSLSELLHRGVPAVSLHAPRLLRYSVAGATLRPAHRGNPCIYCLIAQVRPAK